MTEISSAVSESLQSVGSAAKSSPRRHHDRSIGTEVTEVASRIRGLAEVLDQQRKATTEISQNVFRIYEKASKSNDELRSINERLVGVRDGRSARLRRCARSAPRGGLRSFASSRMPCRGSASSRSCCSARPSLRRCSRSARPGTSRSPGDRRTDAPARSSCRRPQAPSRHRRPAGKDPRGRRISWQVGRGDTGLHSVGRGHQGRDQDRDLSPRTGRARGSLTGCFSLTLQQRSREVSRSSCRCERRRAGVMLASGRMERTADASPLRRASGISSSSSQKRRRCRAQCSKDFRRCDSLRGPPRNARAGSLFLRRAFSRAARRAFPKGQVATIRRGDGQQPGSEQICNVGCRRISMLRPMMTIERGGWPIA